MTIRYTEGDMKKVRNQFEIALNSVIDNDGWKLIKDAPPSDVTELAGDDPIRFLVWVKNALGPRKGDVAFGYIRRYKSEGLCGIATGYSGSGWKVTHYRPIPAGPKRGK